MNSNYFNDVKKEYIMKDMYPVRPWLNYAWNDVYVSSFNQFGFGISRFKDENGFIKNILAGGANRLIYIKDKKDGEYWAANRNFDNKDFDAFETAVGMGYSVIHSEYKGLSTDLKLFVPDKGFVECWEVTIKNTSDEDKDISLYAYTTLDTLLDVHGYTKSNFVKELNGLCYTYDGYKPKTSIKYMFFNTDGKIDAYETTTRRFTGIYSDISHPIALEDEMLSSKDDCYTPVVAAALQFNLKLEKGGEKKLRFVLGAAESKETIKKVNDKLLCKGAFDKELKLICDKVDNFQQNVMVETPDADINSRTNIWLKRQMELGKQWGRMYGKGFRDIMQDTMAFLCLNRENARDRILYSLQYQREDGNPVRQWDPYLEDVYVDGAVWLIFTINVYLKETSDFAILDEKVPYYESDVKETVLEHCYRGIDYLQNSLGEHGLSLWGMGDWNDSLNACGILGKGESVWLSQAVYKAAYDFVEILNKIGKTEKVAQICEKAEKMKENIFKYGWDKDHFIYGINDYGEKIGSYDTEEGNIFLNTQVWAILAGIIDGDEAKKLMDLVEDKLGCSYGYTQQFPSYTKGDDKIGRQSYFNPGVYENGSVYNHGVAFKAVADCMRGDGTQALDTIKRILPSNPEVKHSGVEFYAMTNMYFGPECTTRKGDAPASWITGTSGWVFRGIVEYILGVIADFDGLAVRPNLPDCWDSVKIKRNFRNCVYNIKIENSYGKGYTIFVDGTPIEGDILPLFDDNKEHDVLLKHI